MNLKMSKDKIKELFTPKKMDVNVNPTFHLKTDKSNSKDFEIEAKWFKNPKGFIVEDFPLQLDIETNTICNLRCKKCFFSYTFLVPREMELNYIKKMIREGSYKGLESIKFQYRGEPLMYPHLIEAIKYAKEYGIKATFNTNGTLLNATLIAKLCRAETDLIICSIDSYIKEVYEDLHRGGIFSKVLRNLKNLQTYKKVHHLIVPILRVQQVMQPENMREKEKFVEFWSKIANQVSQVEYLDYQDILPDGTKIMENWACPSPWQRLVIWADGSVHPCCSLNSSVVGNIHADSIEDIWKGERMETLRNLHKNGKSHKNYACSRCAIRKHEYRKRCNEIE